jgi:co-chaperonin GroES (HSP10)
MRIRPIQDYVLVRVDGAEVTFDGDALSEGRHGASILLPELAQDAAHTGTVAAVGRGRWTRKGVFVPTSLDKGDCVWFRWCKGAQVIINGMLHLFIREGAVINDEREIKSHGIEAVVAEA